MLIYIMSLQQKKRMVITKPYGQLGYSFNYIHGCSLDNFTLGKELLSYFVIVIFQPVLVLTNRIGST